MKKLIIAFIAASTLAACNSGESESGNFDGYIINGQVNGASETLIYLEELSFSNAKVLDTAKIGSDGKFTMKGKIPMSGLHRLRINNEKAWMMMINNGENITFTADFKDIQNHTFEGSPDTRQMLGFMDGLKPLQERLNQAYQYP